MKKKNGKILECGMTEEELFQGYSKYKAEVDMLSRTINGGVAKMVLEDGLRVIEASEGYYRMTGYTEEESHLPPFLDRGANLLLKEDLPLVEEAVHRISMKSQPVTVSYRIRKKDGSIAWNSAFSAVAEKNSEGLSVIDVFFIDTTASKTTELQRDEQFRIVSEYTKETLYDWDMVADEINYSSVYKKMFGYDPPDGISAAGLLDNDYIHEEDKPIVAEVFRNLRSGKPNSECEYRARRVDGTYFWCRNRATVIFDVNNNPIRVIGVLSDVDEYHKTNAALRNEAMRDSMTGLLNHMAMQRQIEARLNKGRLRGKHVLLQMDVDHFKQINDFMGHRAGDRALIEISSYISELFREGDLVGRMGGDEFAVFFGDIGSEYSAMERVHKIVEEIHRDFRVGDKIYPLSISIGVAFYPKDGTDFQTLYEHADIALYAAKNAGGNTVCKYEMEKQNIREKSH